MKILKKILIILLIAYVGMVFSFESWLGYSQPQGRGVVTINTTDDEGITTGRAVSLITNGENLYIARNHWPKRWYDQAIENPNVSLENEGVTTEYLAASVSGEEHDQVDADNPLPTRFRFLTGYPPRYFIRLDPK